MFLPATSLNEIKKRGNSSNNRTTEWSWRLYQVVTPQNPKRTEAQKTHWTQCVQVFGQRPSSSIKTGYTACDGLFKYWVNANDLFKRPRYWLVYFTYLIYFNSLTSVTSVDLNTSPFSKNMSNHKHVKDKVVRQVGLFEYTEKVPNQVCVVLLDGWVIQKPLLEWCYCLPLQPPSQLASGFLWIFIIYCTIILWCYIFENHPKS